jgi:predicted kinase
MGQSKPRLVILVGQIASGKSTTAMHLYDNNDFFVVSLDAMRKMLGAGGYVYDQAWEPLIQTTEQFLLKKAFKEKFDIVVDDARMVIRKFRKDIIKQAKQEGYKVFIVETPHVDKKTAVERRLKANFCPSLTRKDWEAVYDKFDRFWEEVSAKECDALISLQNGDDLKMRFKEIL